jgi:protein phosphatase
MHFQSVALSDRGLNREINEDSAWIGSQIIAVADGLGGHAGGEVASAIVINGLAKADETMRNEEVLSTVFFVVKLGPDCYQEHLKSVIIDE